MDLSFIPWMCWLLYLVRPLKAQNGYYYNRPQQQFPGRPSGGQQSDSQFEGYPYERPSQGFEQVQSTQQPQSDSYPDGGPQRPQQDFTIKPLSFGLTSDNKQTSGSFTGTQSMGSFTVGQPGAKPPGIPFGTTPTLFPPTPTIGLPEPPQGSLSVTLGPGGETQKPGLVGQGGPATQLPPTQPTFTGGKPSPFQPAPGSGGQGQGSFTGSQGGSGYNQGQGRPDYGQGQTGGPTQGLTGGGGYNQGQTTRPPYGQTGSTTYYPGGSGTYIPGQSGGGPGGQGGAVPTSPSFVGQPGATQTSSGVTSYPGGTQFPVGEQGSTDQSSRPGVTTYPGQGLPPRPEQTQTGVTTYPGQSGSFPAGGSGLPSRPGQTEGTPSRPGATTYPGQTGGTAQPSRPGQTGGTQTLPGATAYPGQTGGFPNGGPGQPSRPGQTGIAPSRPGVSTFPGQTGGAGQGRPPRPGGGQEVVPTAEPSPDGDQWSGDYSAIPGEPEIDYPIYTSIPKTSFKCRDQRYPGYYADVEARCQVFHVCANNLTYDFLCPNGTIFHQQHFVCVWWNQFDCETAPSLYDLNRDIYDYSIKGSQGPSSLQDTPFQQDVPTRPGSQQFGGVGPTASTGGFQQGQQPFPGTSTLPGQQPLGGVQQPGVTSLPGQQPFGNTQPPFGGAQTGTTALPGQQPFGGAQQPGASIPGSQPFGDSQQPGLTIPSQQTFGGGPQPGVSMIPGQQAFGGQLPGTTSLPGQQPLGGIQKPFSDVQQQFGGGRPSQPSFSQQGQTTPWPQPLGDEYYTSQPGSQGYPQQPGATSPAPFTTQAVYGQTTVSDGGYSPPQGQYDTFGSGPSSGVKPSREYLPPYRR